MKRNLTIQLDEEIIQQARVLAAERGTSISGLLARTLTRETLAAQRYREAKEQALAAFPKRDTTAEPTERTWTREDLYDRWK